MEEEEQTLINNSDRAKKSSSYSWSNQIAFSVTTIIISGFAIVVAMYAALQTRIYISNMNHSHNACMLHPITCDTDPNFSAKYTHLPSSVLVVAAHPDDIEACAGGTLSKWAAAGSSIYYIMITNGDKGTHNHSMTSEELGKIRKQEQKNAGKVVGVKNIFFLDVPDGEVQNNDHLRYNLTYYIRLLRPELMLTWDPTWHLDLFQFGLEHRDHRTAGQASIDAVWPTSNDFLYYPEQNLPSYRPKTMLLFRFWKDFEYNVPQSQVYVELSDKDMDTKVKAIWEHKSQIPDDKAREAEKQFLMNMASKFGKVERTKYAELFTLVRFMT